MCVSSEGPYSIGAHRKLPFFSLHRNAVRHMLCLETGLVSKQDRVLCSRSGSGFGPGPRSFFFDKTETKTEQRSENPSASFSLGNRKIKSASLANHSKSIYWSTFCLVGSVRSNHRRSPVCTLNFSVAALKQAFCRRTQPLTPASSSR